VNSRSEIDSMPGYVLQLPHDVLGRRYHVAVMTGEAVSFLGSGVTVPCCSVTIQEPLLADSVMRVMAIFTAVLFYRGPSKIRCGPCPRPRVWSCSIPRTLRCFMR
jgi:hypothetical protein